MYTIGTMWDTKEYSFSYVSLRFVICEMEILSSATVLFR